MKKIILTSIVISLLLASGVNFVLAENTNNALPPATNKFTVDLTCMQEAVEKRDTAITAAWDKFSAAIKSALETRKAALKAAWGLRTKRERAVALAKAWKDWRTTVRSARQTFKNERKAAWQQFKVDRKKCRATGEDTSSEIKEGFDISVW